MISASTSYSASDRCLAIAIEASQKYGLQDFMRNITLWNERNAKLVDDGSAYAKRLAADLQKEKMGLDSKISKIARKSLQTILLHASHSSPLT